MKYLKWLLVVPIAVSPLLLWFTLGTEWVLWGLFFCFLAALAVCLSRNYWTGKELAWTALTVKILQFFPSAYILRGSCLLGVFSAWAATTPPNDHYVMFLLGELVSFLLVLFLLLYVLCILPACLLGLAAVLRCRKEGRLTSKQAVVYGVLQFVFLADVVCAILLCRATFKKEDP